MDRITRSRCFDDGRDRWRMVEARPEARLTGLVDQYVWWSEDTQSFTTRRELAATTGVLIVNLGSELTIVDAQGEHHRFRAGEGFIAGAAQATSMSHSTGAMTGVHVRAPLPTLACLAGVPLAELTNRVVRLSDLAAVRRSALGDRLLAARSHNECWSLLDRFVAGRLANSTPYDPAVDHLMRHLAAGCRVQLLADDIGWSRKRLAERFRAATGLHPRTFAGLARFERFTVLLAAGPGEGLADLAFAAGYADQAHLTREVARFAAVTPGELRRRLLPQGGGVRD